jgi:putative membrane protein
MCLAKNMGAIVSPIRSRRSPFHQEIRMKLVNIAFAACAFVLAGAMSFRSAAAGADNPAAHAHAPAASQSEALGLLMAVNDHEIKAAQLAQGKSVSASTLAYAQMLEKEHTDNQARTRELKPPVKQMDSAAVIALQEKGAAERAALAARDGSEFERAYIDAMVKGHAEALTRIDHRLLPAATDAAVRTHFTETRRHVAAHLARAREIQARLDG